jgi:hypothetical protein
MEACYDGGAGCFEEEQNMGTCTPSRQCLASGFIQLNKIQKARSTDTKQD